MKKQILTALAALLALPGLAQTNFRSITFDEALAAAKAENKMVFIDFYTDWCGPCKAMARDVFPQKAVGDYMNEKFVCIKLNAEKEGKEFADLYKVEYFPTFIVLDTDKKVIVTKIGFEEGQSFIDDLNRKLDPEMSPEKLKARYDSGERTPDLISAYASLKMAELREKVGKTIKSKEVLKIVYDYYKDLSDADRLSPKNLFVYQQYVESPTDEPARFMVAHRDEFDADMRVEIDKVLSKLYQAQVYGYFSGTKPYDAATYELIKNEINTLGFNADKKYDNCFRFIECHAKGDLNAYLDLCEKEYPSLDERRQSSLVVHFAGLIKTDDAAIRQRAAKFLRSHVAEMSAGNMFFVADQLMDLEGQKH